MARLLSLLLLLDEGRECGPKVPLVGEAAQTRRIALSANISAVAAGTPETLSVSSGAFSLQGRRHSGR